MESNEAEKKNSQLIFPSENKRKIEPPKAIGFKAWLQILRLMFSRIFSENEYKRMCKFLHVYIHIASNNNTWEVRALMVCLVLGVSKVSSSWWRPIDPLLLFNCFEQAMHVNIFPSLSLLFNPFPQTIKIPDQIQQQPNFINKCTR